MATPNRLANEKSPYLLQHAHNPVDWFSWGEEAFEKARRENRPIFLSVGYSTCHWCHVMERESFENEAIAEVLNQNFVSIKVDREERPDVDRVYMLFVQASTGSGGWPMSVWLTPERKPFFGGTYFPPDNRYGRPGFRAVLERLAEARPEIRACRSDCRAGNTCLRKKASAPASATPTSATRRFRSTPARTSCTRGPRPAALRDPPLSAQNSRSTTARSPRFQTTRAPSRGTSGRSNNRSIKKSAYSRARLLERLLAPRIPVHGIVSVLQQVRTLFVTQSIHFS